MIRLVALLGALLAVSVAGNLWQWRAGIVRGVEQRASIDVARAEGVAQAHAQTAQRVSLIAQLAQADSAALLASLWQIAERSRERVTVYRERIVAAPPLDAVCAPGDVRVDAVNQMLGHGE